MVFYLIPEKIRMVIVAIVGSCVGWLTYELIYYVNPFSAFRASSSWLIEFLIGVARQHAFHRWFTFTHHVSYWKSLGRAYMFYSVSAGVGAGIDFVLTEHLHVNHRLAWGICLIVTALISLFALKKIVFGPVIDRRSNVWKEKVL